MNYFCILSAGQGTRLEMNMNKGLIPFGKNTLLEYNINKLLSLNIIDKIFVVSSQDSKNTIDNILNKFQDKKIINESVIGGNRRQDSAYKAIQFLEKIGIQDNDNILFHNVANPFFSHKEIHDLLDAMTSSSAAVLGRKVKSTIRKINYEKQSEGIVDRRNLYEMETPQIIKYKTANEGFKKVEKENIEITDDVSLAEINNKEVQICECSDLNFKITTKSQYNYAKYLLTTTNEIS